MTKKIVHNKALNKAAKYIAVTSYPDNNNLFFYITLSLAFFVNFVIYLLTLAPSVTFEDSGDFISAAYNMGVAHEPGYPLFCMLGKLFSLIPAGDIAFRLNLLSAVCSSVAAIFICHAVILLLEETFINSKFWQTTDVKKIRLIKYSVALSASIFFGTSYEIWEQSVITEVYGLNNLFLGLFILLALLWHRQTTIQKKQKYFYYISFITGLSLTNHDSSLLIIPVYFVYIVSSDIAFLLNVKTLSKAVLFFIIGLIPLVYLPLASLQNPINDWGNPENLRNFIRVIMRHQYQSTDAHTLQGYISQFKYSMVLLSEQWYPVFLILSAFGLYAIFRYNKSFFYFCLIYLLFSIPIMVYMTNTDITNPVSAEVNKNTVSVAYTLAYILISVITGAGIFHCISFLSSKRIVSYEVMAGISLLFAVSNIFRNYKEEDMSKYNFPKYYADNLFNTLPKNSLLFINWDPFGFPLNYYQFVEHKRPDIIVIDQLLLKRSWYIHWIREHFKDFAEKSEKEMISFINAVEPFENGSDYDGNYIQLNYINMINSFIDNKLKENNEVFFTYYPEKSILRKYYLEPLFSAYKYTKGEYFDSSIKESDINIDIYLNRNIKIDVMALAVKDYYGNIFASRGLLMENFGKKEEAIRLYQVAREIFRNNPVKLNKIEERLTVLHAI